MSRDGALSAAVRSPLVHGTGTGWETRYRLRRPVEPCAQSSCLADPWGELEREGGRREGQGRIEAAHVHE
jgi:hypothetical protein